MNKILGNLKNSKTNSECLFWSKAKQRKQKGVKSKQINKQIANTQEEFKKTPHVFPVNWKFSLLLSSEIGLIEKQSPKTK